MKRSALIFLGGLLALTVALPASGGRRQADATHVQKAEACIRNALRKENLAIKYIEESKVSDATINKTVIGAALDDLACALNETSRAYGSDEITQPESSPARTDLTDAQEGDAKARTDLTDGYRTNARYWLGLRHAGYFKNKALTVLEKATAPSTAKPVLKPISAVFTQSLYHTVFTEDATGTELSYSWSVSIPADPGCADGFKGNVPTANEATWYHADKNIGGPCEHIGKDYGVSGHPGTTTVVVMDADWRCVATYYGTLTGTGSQPETCTQR